MSYIKRNSLLIELKRIKVELKRIGRSRYEEMRYGMTTIGCLRVGDIFLLDGIKYKVGHLIENTNGYVACVDVESRKVKRFYIDTMVEEVWNEK